MYKKVGFYEHRSSLGVVAYLRQALREPLLCDTTVLLVYALNEISWVAFGYHDDAIG